MDDKQWFCRVGKTSLRRLECSEGLDGEVSQSDACGKACQLKERAWAEPWDWCEPRVVLELQGGLLYVCEYITIC